MCKPTCQGIWKGSICSMLMVWLGNALGIAMTGNGGTGSSLATGYSLDLTNRTGVMTISQEVTTPQAIKFVQIEVAKVFNPQKIPLSFSVHYQPVHGEKSLLGTFSLFPPDNPGTFIVATRGELQSGGMVIVSLVPLEHVGEKAEIQVQLKRISFMRE